MIIQSKINDDRNFNDRKYPNLYRRLYAQMLKEKYQLLSNHPMDQNQIIRFLEIEKQIMRLDHEAGIHNQEYATIQPPTHGNTTEGDM